MLTRGRSIDPSTGPPGSNKEVITASRTADPSIASCQFREVGSKDCISARHVPFRSRAPLFFCALPSFGLSSRPFRYTPSAVVGTDLTLT